MKELSFTYLRKIYRGFLAASTQAYPQLYWYFMEDPELCEELGDCLCFKRQGPGPLEPAELFPKHQEWLINTIREVVEKSEHQPAMF